MDISAGSQQDGVVEVFPNGVPAVSDASMTHWMEYVYKQQPKPTDATGVRVTINVVDANGNYRTIGTATSDATGFYSLQWTPDIPGKYTVYATFDGSESYWSSQATTAFSVDTSSATPTPLPIQVTSIADQYIVPGIIGIIVAIVIGFAATILILRKRQ